MKLGEKMRTSLKKRFCLCLTFILLATALLPSIGTASIHTPISPRGQTPSLLEKDYDTFTKGLEGLPVVPGSGGVTALSEEAFPVNVPEAVPNIAASRFGDGRIVLAGDQKYFSLKNNDDPLSLLARNTLLWLTEEANLNNGKGTRYTGRYEEALDQNKMLRIVTNSEEFTIDSSLPIEIVKVDKWDRKALNPNKYTVAIIDETVKQDEVSHLAKYVQQGGNIIAAINGGSLEGITRNTPVEKRAQLGNWRGIRISQHYPVQKLLNRMGLSLLNNKTYPVGTTSELTLDTIQENHAINRLREGKQIEQGILDYEDINMGPTGTDNTKKQSLLLSVLTETLESLTSDSPLYDWAMKEAASYGKVQFPVKRGEMPYRNSLLNFQFSHFTIDAGNEKSPYADEFPGEVSETAQPVKNKKISINLQNPDLMYTRALPSKNWISTGLYASPGKDVTINVPEGVENVSVQIGSHDDELNGLSEWKRVPNLVHFKKLSPGKNVISSPYGGLIYFIPMMTDTPEQQVEFSISGAIEAPFYEIGKTTKQEWDKIRERGEVVPFGELKGEKLIITIPSKYLLELEDPLQVVALWDEIVASYDRLAGLDSKNDMPNKKYPIPFRIVLDKQIKGGLMHAGNPIMAPIEYGSTNYAASIVNETYIKNDAWGFWHEIGHEYQQAPWTWGDLGEVTVNLFSLLTQEKFNNPSRLLVVTNGKDSYDRALEFVMDPNPQKLYKELGNFERLVMFQQLRMVYGWEFYTSIFTAYREMPDKQLPKTNQEMIDTFVTVASQKSGNNLLEFFSKWGIYCSEDAQTYINNLNLDEPETEIWLLREEKK
ncbi:M60 family metallopeptidase [Bacillus pakistanensis]|nr:M60 family metallopeptidase [Bacillus pakistanensis]